MAWLKIKLKKKRKKEKSALSPGIMIKYVVKQNSLLKQT